ncbi:MAG: AAA family ATPase [Proteobacteria bacterium]|nr:AAA family ATPase [Burkholderiales bacterium]
MALLAGARSRASAGQGHSVFVSGEAGIGKTSLVEAFVRSEQLRTRVLWGACDALSTPRPLGPVRDIAQMAGGELLASLNAGLPGYRLFQSFLDALNAHPGGTLAVVEDAHWADDATADFIKFVARRISRCRAVLVVTFREDEVRSGHPLLRAIANVPADHATRVRLHGLSANAVARLAADHARQIRNLHTITDGNPLLVTELLRAPGDEVSASLRDTMLARLDRLSPFARDLAELVAVVPDRIEREFLDRISTANMDALPECIDNRTLVFDRGYVRYRHELVRGIIERSLNEVRRRLLHARVLAALEGDAAFATLARLVHHADGAGDAAKVLRYAPPAATESSLRGAHRQSAELYRRALCHSGTLLPLERARLMDSLAVECALTGASEEALAANARSFQLLSEAGETFAQGANRRARFEMLHVGVFRRRSVEFAVLAQSCVTLLESHGASGELAKAYMNEAFVLSMEGRAGEADIRHGQAVATAESAGERAALCHVLLEGELRKHSFFCEPDSSAAERALALALKDDDDLGAAKAYFCLSMFALNSMRLDDAERALNAGLRFADARDLDGHKAPLLALEARKRFVQGDWSHAEARATELLTDADLPGIAELNALFVLGQYHARTGGGPARSYLERALDTATSKIGSLLSKIHALVRLAELHWLEGEDRTALDFAHRGVLEAESMRGYPWVREMAVFWLWRLGGPSNEGEAPATPYGLQTKGDWSAAAAAWEALGCPYERALALCDGDAEAQRSGIWMLDRLGARASVARCRGLLARRGVVRIPRGPRPSTRIHPLGLTRRELEVLALLGEGLGNAAIGDRLHRSHRTVSHHVTAIMAKLGAGTRREAVLTAHEKGLLKAKR